MHFIIYVIINNLCLTTVLPRSRLRGGGRPCHGRLLPFSPWREQAVICGGGGGGEPPWPPCSCSGKSQRGWDFVCLFVLNPFWSSVVKSFSVVFFMTMPKSQSLLFSRTGELELQDFIRHSSLSCKWDRWRKPAPTSCHPPAPDWPLYIQANLKKNESN